MDVAETAGGYWDLLRRYLSVAVDLDLLAAQAGLRPGGDICGETLPNIPEGDEAAGRPPARVGGPVEVFENLEESQMRSRSPTFCVMMCRPGLERRACTCGQRIWRRAIAGRDSASATTFDVPGTYTNQLVSVFQNECQVALLAARGRR